MSLASHLPAPIKRRYWKLLGWNQNRRFPTCHGLTFASTWRWLKRAARWDDDEIRAYQLHTLRRLVALAYEHTEFYRRRYDEAGVRPDHIRTLADARLLPVVTKDDLKAHVEAMVNRSVDPDRLEFGSTGGSTGEPTRVCRFKHDDLQVELAFILRQWFEAGYRHGDRILTLRGGRLADEHYRDGIAVKRDRRRNALLLSPIDLSEANYDAILRTIRRFRPHVVEAFPSALHWLTRAIDAAGDEAPRVKAVFLESESIPAGAAALIERVWGGRVFGAYGNSERSADAVQCPAGRDYHVNYEYGLVELLDDDGEPIDEPGRAGSLVTTGFFTAAAPLIRYDTLDRGRWTDAGPCACRRRGPRLAHIDGRREDFFITAAGAAVCTSAINIHTAALDALAQFQLEQRRAGELIFHYLPVEGRAIDEAALIAAVVDQIGDDIRIECRRASRFDRTARGKLRLLIQHLDLDAHARPAEALAAGT